MLQPLDPSLLLPNSFDIDVSAYDDNELLLLKKLPQWPTIEKCIRSGKVKIDKQTFLKYSLFRQRDIWTPAQIAARVLHREALLTGLLEMRDGSIGINPSCDGRNHRSEAEEIGEAFGLCIGDDCFGTTDLDWSRIEESRTKDRTLDAFASNGVVKIEWESKGSIVHGDDLRPAKIGNHKGSIKTKKLKLPPSPPDVVRLGSIAVLRGKSSIPSNVFIVDPPVEYQDRSPEQIRDINRLRNIADLISTLKPRSPFAAALQSRLAAIVAIQDFSRLEAEELLNGIAQPFEMGVGEDGTHSRFFSARSQVQGDNVGGHAVFIDNAWLFFFGMQGQLVELVAQQQFREVASYTATNVSQQRTVNCVFGVGAFERATKIKPDKRNSKFQTDGQYVSFSASGMLHYTVGGSVFGWLSRPEGI